jgi:vancomycin resistance protein YoaR
LAEGYIDFKFKNNTDLPIAVFSSIDKNKLSVKIYGGAADKKPGIRLISEVSEVIPPGEAEIIVDPTLKPDEKVVSREAQNGLKVKVYREVYIENKLIQRELVSEDRYAPVKGQLKVGAAINGIKELIVSGSGQGSQ